MSILKEVLARRAAVTEGAEEIVELSKGTLNSYIHKSSHDIMKRSAGDKNTKRAAGLSKAAEKLKEEVEELTEEQLEEIVNTMTVLEYEQLDELSKNTLKSYVKKATKSADKHYAKADSEEDKAMSTDGHKHPEKQARHQAAANKHIAKWRNRDNGVKKATSKLSK